MWSFNTIVMNCISRRIAFVTVLLILALPGSYLLGYVHNHFSLFGPNDALFKDETDYWGLYFDIRVANVLDTEDTGVEKKYFYLWWRLGDRLRMLTTLDSHFNHAELTASKPRRCAQVRKTLSFYHQYHGNYNVPDSVESITRNAIFYGLFHIGNILPNLEKYLQEHCLAPFFDSAGEESK